MTEGLRAAAVSSIPAIVREVSLNYTERLAEAWIEHPSGAPATVTPSPLNQSVHSRVANSTASKFPKAPRR